MPLSTYRGSPCPSPTPSPPPSPPPNSSPPTEILITIYDLLPPSSFSSLLWRIGASLLHTGVHIPCLSYEFAYGGHSIPHRTGVYHTHPLTPPPGGHFRLSLPHGTCTLSPKEIRRAIGVVSEEFLGTKYNLLQRNCNHFTMALVERLTGKQAPAWLNRAAKVGLALPCVVPRQWIAPPEAGDQGGELVEEADGDWEGDERTGMLRGRRKGDRKSLSGRSEEQREEGSKVRVQDGQLRDTGGREIPPAERAPAR